MQSYKNHIRYYPTHHFVFYPVILLLTAFCVRKAIIDPINQLIWIFMALVFLMVGWLSFMLRQHYALTLQNRLVVDELRFRYYTLTQRRLELLEDRLSFGQMAALRFAPDNELPALVQKAMEQDLSPNQIKKLIVKWLPDTSRV
jgi:hypothetical protein